MRIPAFLAAVFVVGLLFAGARPAAALGFQWGMAENPDGKPLQVAIWYPSDAVPTDLPFGPYRQNVALGGAVSGKGLPLIVMSHGTGGSLFNSYDTAIALAEAGFVVVAVTHDGDNYLDRAVSFSQRNFEGRPRQVGRVIDYILTDWAGHESLDPARIGLFGHSAGGTTALIAVGGRMDWGKVIAFCRDTPQDWGCRNARQANGEALESTPVTIAGFDPRIRAAVVAAPALTESFLPDGLAGVKVPLQLWVAAKDEIVTNAVVVRALVPATLDYHLVEGAGHFAFLAPCSDILAVSAPEICKDPEGFDRPAFLQRFHGAVAAFFQEHLKAE